MKTKLVFLALIFAFGCSDQFESTEVEPQAYLTGDNGKGDGTSFSVKDYFKNTANLDLSDLAEQVVNYATAELNQTLSAMPYVDLEVQPTRIFSSSGGQVFGLASESLDNVINNLSAAYGSDAVTAEINAVRKQYLMSGQHDVFAESEFRLAVGGNFSFTTALGDGDGTVGFLPSSELRARLVSAHNQDNLNALPGQPLKILNDERGFILPTTIADIRSMRPGESVTLEGSGRLGFNVGSNLPIYSFDPINHLTLSARFHLGGRVLTEGMLDIHLVRSEGDMAIVEVGISDIRSRGISVGIQSGFGLTDIPPLLEIDLGGQTWSLGQLAEKLIERRLEKSGLLSYGAEALREGAKSRITLERYRVQVGADDDLISRALFQALTGDLRLMQALADRGQGVRQEVSFERNLNELRRYRGAHLSSMKFFAETHELEGSVSIRTNENAQEILFEDLQESRGRFFRDWGFRRLIMTSSEWQNSQYVGSKANLRLAVTESDSFTARDQILDHVDAALLAVMPFEVAYENLTRLYEELQQQVDIHCRACTGNDSRCRREYRECVESRLSDDEVAEWRSGLESETTSILNEIPNDENDPDLDDARMFAEALLNLKLQLSSIKEVAAALADVAGETQILSDVRFGQNGLDSLFRNVDATAFETRLREVLVVVVSKRSKDYDRKYDRALDWVDDQASKLDDLVSIYERSRDAYLRLDDQARIQISGKGVSNGAYVLEQLSEEDTTPVIRSIAESKAKIVAEMVDEMVDRGEQLSLIQTLLRVFSLGLIDPRTFESHHLITYTLTTLIEPQGREWLLSLNFEEDVLPDLQLFNRGADAQGFIQAGQFSLDLLTRPEL